MQTFDTVTEALSWLKQQGYNIDFNIAFDKIVCNSTNTILNVDEFEITSVYRFEGDTNPADEDVIYAIESKDGLKKGVLLSAYGAYADAVSNEMIKKLSIHK